MTSNIENGYDVNRQLCVPGPAVSINRRESESPGPYAGNRWLVNLCWDLYQLQSSEHRQDISLAAGQSTLRYRLHAKESRRRRNATWVRSSRPHFLWQPGVPTPNSGHREFGTSRASWI